MIQEREGGYAWGQQGRTWSSTAREQDRTEAARADSPGNRHLHRDRPGLGVRIRPSERLAIHSPLGAHVLHRKKKDPQKTIVFSSAVEETWEVTRPLLPYRAI